MKEPVLSPDFTIQDIHKIREYNYEVTKNMTFQERKAYYDKYAQKGLDKIKHLKRTRTAAV